MQKSSPRAMFSRVYAPNCFQKTLLYSFMILKTCAEASPASEIWSQYSPAGKSVRSILPSFRPSHRVVVLVAHAAALNFGLGLKADFISGRVGKGCDFGQTIFDKTLAHGRH